MKRQCQAGIDESSHQNCYYDEANEFTERDYDDDRLELSARKHPNHKAKENQRQQVVDHATCDDYPCYPRVLANLRSFRLLSVITTAVAVMVSPTKVAPMKSRPNSKAMPKLTVNGTMAPTTATPIERFNA